MLEFIFRWVCFWNLVLLYFVFLLEYGSIGVMFVFWLILEYYFCVFVNFFKLFRIIGILFCCNCYLSLKVRFGWMLWWFVLFFIGDVYVLVFVVEFFFFKDFVLLWYYCIFNNLFLIFLVLGLKMNIGLEVYNVFLLIFKFLGGCVRCWNFKFKFLL